MLALPGTIAQVGRPGEFAEAAVSVREAEVLSALGRHLTNAEIGAELFISVRTVESHVSSLLRKLQAPDRRALAAMSAAPAQRRPSPTEVGPTLPSSLTPFVGRSAERAALSAALRDSRLVTAVGPGGIGKTRLALAVAADVAENFPDGVSYVDLVPVTDPAMVARTVADAFGLPERQGVLTVDALMSWLADKQLLLVLDNCEHLLDSVIVLTERLLSAGPRSEVLATSRSRLLVPFERVFLVPGLSVDPGPAGSGDAVELFLGRVAAAGGPAPIAAGERARIAALCRALDGVALAIELAAARYPSVGLDGLEAGLADRLGLLSGGARIDDRHRSLRATLEWSYALLPDLDRAVLRRLSVFAEPFTAAAAAQVLADWSPVGSATVPVVLARLADHSLLTAVAGPAGTRYRVLEIVRQYGAERLAEDGESVEACARHLRWCLDQATALEVASRLNRPWQAAFELVADELRAALRWASGEPQRRGEAHRLATVLGQLCFSGGTLGETQRRYEQAAELAPDDRTAADAWRHAAGAAESRHFGNDALRLRQQAAEAAIRAGDPGAAAADLAQTAERINRGPGLMAVLPPAEAVRSLIEQGWALAGDDRTAQARLHIAEAFAGSETDESTLRHVRRALELARATDDRLAQSAALDQLTSIQLVAGDLGAAAASTILRTELLEDMPATAMTGFEMFDGLIMATECAIATGDLAGARRLAQRLRDLSFYRRERHIATSRLLVVTVLAGDWDEAAELAAEFGEDWNHAGRPRAGNLVRGAYAVSTMYALRADTDAHERWAEISNALQSPGNSDWTGHVNHFFDALLLLHQGFEERVIAELTAAPEDFTHWYAALWRPWYAALWAEAAVLTGAPDADDRLTRARSAAGGNPIAGALVDRAWAVQNGALTGTMSAARTGLTDAAAALLEAGCRYQWARTLIMLGGADRTVGESALARMGAQAMAWPRESG